MKREKKIYYYNKQRLELVKSINSENSSCRDCFFNNNISACVIFNKKGNRIYPCDVNTHYILKPLILIVLMCLPLFVSAQSNTPWLTVPDTVYYAKCPPKVLVKAPIKPFKAPEPCTYTSVPVHTQDSLKRIILSQVLNVQVNQVNQPQMIIPQIKHNHIGWFVSSGVNTLASLACFIIGSSRTYNVYQGNVQNKVYINGVLVSVQDTPFDNRDVIRRQLHKQNAWFTGGYITGGIGLSLLTVGIIKSF